MRSRGRVLLDPKVLGASSDFLFGLHNLQASSSAIFYSLNLGGNHLAQLLSPTDLTEHLGATLGSRVSCRFVKDTYDR